LQMVNSSGCYMAALAIPDNVFLILHATFSSIRWCPNCVMLTNYPVMCQVNSKPDVIETYVLANSYKLHIKISSANR